MRGIDRGSTRDVVKNSSLHVWDELVGAIRRHAISLLTTGDVIEANGWPLLLTFPTEDVDLRGVRRVVGDWLDTQEVSVTTSTALVLATHEAVANALEHGKDGHSVTVRGRIAQRRRHRRGERRRRLADSSFRGSRTRTRADDDRRAHRRVRAFIQQARYHDPHGASRHRSIGLSRRVARAHTFTEARPYVEQPYRWSQRWFDDPPIGTIVFLGNGNDEGQIGASKR